MNCKKTIILSFVAAVLIGTAGAVFAAEDRGFYKVEVQLQ